MRLGNLWRERGPELILLFCGIAIRFSMLLTFPVEEGYDFPFHWQVVEHVEQHGAMPPPTFNVSAYHQPLFYFIAAGLKHIGFSMQAVALFSVLCGAVRLVLIARGLERYVPESRLARRIALLVAAFFPPSIHLDAMVQSEPLSNLLATVAMLLAPRLLEGPLGRRWRAAAWLGLVLGIELLTKISGFALIAAFGLGALCELALRAEAGLSGRVKRAAPWLLTLALAAGISGWHFVGSYRRTGSVAPTSFELSQAGMMARHRHLPVLARRPISFVVGWSWSIYGWPYYPSAAQPPERSHFFPVLLASTFSDYYNFAYCPTPRPGEPDLKANGRAGPRPACLWFSRASVVGGTAVALATVLGWFAALVWLWRRRAYERLVLLFVPAVALAAALYFSIKYPIDPMGVTKGAYLQFAAPPLYALFGVAVAWLWQRRRGRPLAVLCLAGLAPVILYTLYARVAVPLLDWLR